MIPFPEKRYNIIYADPPWAYNQAGRGAATNHYQTMTTADICKMPVREITGGGRPVFFGQHSQTSPRLSRSWRRGDFDIRRRHLSGSKRPRPAGTSGGWAHTPAPTRRYACWVWRRILRLRRGSRPTTSTRSSRPLSRDTAKSRMKSGSASSAYWATFLGLSCSQGNGPLDGTHGAMNAQDRQRGGDRPRIGTRRDTSIRRPGKPWRTSAVGSSGKRRRTSRP